MPALAPAFASNTNRPLVFVVRLALTLGPSMETRPVAPISLATYGGGGTKKSPVLIVVPTSVDSKIRPDVAPNGTVKVNAVLEAVEEAKVEE